MGETLVAGILKNIEKLASINVNQNVSILTSIKKTNTILSRQIGKELQKQTILLKSMTESLSKGTFSSLDMLIKSENFIDSFEKNNIQTNNILSGHIGKELQIQTILLEHILKSLSKDTSSSLGMLIKSENFIDSFEKNSTQNNNILHNVIGKELQKHSSLLNSINNVISKDILSSLGMLIKNDSLVLSSLNRTLTPLDDSTTKEMDNPQISSILTCIVETKNILSNNIGSELQTQSKTLNNILGTLKEQKNKPQFNIFGGVKSGLSKFFNKEKMPKTIDAITTSLDKFVDVVNRVDEDKLKALDGFFDMGKKILLFAATVALASPLLAIGTLIVLPLLYAWVTFYRWVSTKAKNIVAGISTTMFMSLSILSIVAALSLSAYAISDIGIQGILLVGGTLLAITGVYILLSKLSKPLKAGGTAILMIALSTVAVVGAILVSSNLLGSLENATEIALIVGGTLLAVGAVYILVSMFAKKMKSGSTAILMVALTTALIVGIIILSAKLIGDSKNATEIALIVGGTLLAVGAVYVLISLFAKPMQKGSMAMLMIALTTAVIVGIIVLTSKYGGEKLSETAMMIGTFIIGIGLSFALAGLIYSQILLGSLAMLSVGIVVGIIAYGLKIFNDADVSLENIGVLSAFIVGMGLAFAGAGLIAPLIGVGAGAMLLVAGSIWIFVDSLKTYNKLEWNNNKTESLSNAITTIVSSLVTAFSNLGIKEFAQLFAGVELLQSLGNALTAFAQGISGFANLELSEVTKNSDGTYSVASKGSINPAAISSNISLLLQEITKPLIEFGQKNGDSGLFSDGALGTGISLLGKLGNSLSSFAFGMSFFGKLKLVQFNEKTGEVIPGTEKGINLEAIGNGIKAIILGTTGVITELGGNGGNWFIKGDYETGLDLLTKLGQPLSQLAETAVTFASQSKKINGIEIGKNIKSIISSFVNAITSVSLSEESKTNGKAILDGFNYFADAAVKINTNNPVGIGEMFVTMKDSINSMDLSKLNKLNSLAKNLSDFAYNMKGSFGDLEDVLERLGELVEKMNIVPTSSEMPKPTKAVESKPMGTSTKQIESNAPQFDFGPLLDELEEIKTTLQSGIEVDLKESYLAR